MRRRWVRRAVWGVPAIALAIVAVFFNDPAQPPGFRGSDGVLVPGYTSVGTLADPSHSDVAQITEALDTRARAALDGDRVAFLGTVDPGRTRFAAQQQVVWENLRRLPLEKLSYRYDGPLQPDRPLESPSFLARVTTIYQLRGFDSAPIEVDDGFTFVRRDDTWKLAGVSDADAQFARSGPPVPWDNGPVATYADRGYLAVVDRGREALARRIVVRCEAGNRASGALLGVENARPTLVLATSHTLRFGRLSGPDAEAVTYPLAGPDGTTSGWGVVVNPDDVDDAVASPVVLPHEVAHLATQEYLAYLPAWLAEGTAEYVGWHSQGGLPAAMAARGYHPAGDLTSLPSSSTFYRRDIQRTYVEGMALVSWIEEHRGRSSVLALLRAYEDAGGYDLSYDPDTATTAILRDTLGLTPAALAAAANAELDAAAGHA